MLWKFKDNFWCCFSGDVYIDDFRVFYWEFGFNEQVRVVGQEFLDDFIFIFLVRAGGKLGL